LSAYESHPVERQRTEHRFFQPADPRWRVKLGQTAGGMKLRERQRTLAETSGSIADGGARVLQGGTGGVSGTIRTVVNGRASTIRGALYASTGT